MIIEAIFNCLFSVVEFVINLIPNYTTLTITAIAQFYNYVSIGLDYVGTAPFIAIITNVLAWCAIDISWAVIEWIYKKIPGVD